MTGIFQNNIFQNNIFQVYPSPPPAATSAPTFIIPYPNDISWERWAGAVIMNNPSFIQQVSVYQSWQDFGQRLSQVVQNVPRPSHFDDWQSWAIALKLALQSSF